jgi:6-phosphogluconolactonase
VSAAATIFLGTYTPKDGASRGIYRTRLDLATGALDEPELAAAAAKPTFLALHPNGRFLYALGEVPDAAGKPVGTVQACALDRATGVLTALNREASGGGGFAHLAVDATGRMVIAVSYHGGYVAAFPLGADGRIGPCTARLPHTGPLGPNKSRQDQAHPHSVTLSPDNRFALVADLGLDRVLVYRLEPAAATLTPAGHLEAAPGAGPRHGKYSADGRFFYLLNEINGTVGVYTGDPAGPDRAPRQVISTLPADFVITDPDRAAEIRIHPNGRFVYASNRGHDSIAVFARDAAAGTLRLVAITPCGGKHPRNFALSPDGAWLVCANMDSNNAVVFGVDATTGRLTPTGRTITVPQAVCVLFAG